MMGSAQKVLVLGRSEISAIRGIGLFETTSYNGLRKGVSYAGGADALIHSSLLQSQPSDNIVHLSTPNLSGTNLSFECPKLTILDEFNSKT